jgi:hypothetical protein
MIAESATHKGGDLMLRMGNRPPFFLGLLAATLFGCSETPGGARDSGGDGSRPDSGGRDTGARDTGAGDTGIVTGDTSVDAPPPLVGEGYAVGQISMNWTLQDQNGQPVNLYDHRGKVIYFESGSEW